jgi:2-polyprenyl-3-methyl-5-hydroxy-6-metoxy-1,4-benzoquinol methylase
MTEAETRTANSRTIDSYEGCAAGYSSSTRPAPGAKADEGLSRFLETLPAGARVLEIASGPGWDADWLEDQGLRIRRTDAALAFIDIQKARGKQVDRLDVVIDDLGGAWDGVIALYVFQHIERADLPGVFDRIAAALKPDGAFLFALREGERDLEDFGSDGGVYHIAEWTRAGLDDLLRARGFSTLWSRSSEDADGRWLTLLTTRSGS